MRIIKGLCSICWLLVTTAGGITAQATSVFGADYFTRNNMEPPIQVGKGFHINDIFKQTRHCFIEKYRTIAQLQSSGEGAKTNITLFQTSNEQEFKELKNKGVDGKVSFLNLFSLGGSAIEKMVATEQHTQERIVFVAKVDFGKFVFGDDPVLQPEADEMLKQGNSEGFIASYGTHYISGVRKENSIWIVLSREKYTANNAISNENTFSMGIPVYGGAKTDFSVTDESSIEERINTEQYSVNVEVNGPTLQGASIQKKISEILSNTDTKNKVGEIKEVLNEMLGKLSDANNARVTQYYYSPFDLYQLKGVNWDARKQTRLTEINELTLNLYQSKIQLASVIGDGNAAAFAKRSLEGLEAYTGYGSMAKKLEKTYLQLNASIKTQIVKAEGYLQQLEGHYQNCSTINCRVEDDCCKAFERIKVEVKQYFEFCASELKKLDAVRQEAVDGFLTELNTPECEKKKQGIVIFENKSSNPYDLFQGDKFIETIEGGGSRMYYLAPGNYYFKAQQRSGYLLYATINYRKAVIQTVCEESRFAIGFED